MDLALIILGLLFIIASMVLFLNPPEAWVKRAFGRSHDKLKPKAAAKSPTNPDEKP